MEEEGAEWIQWLLKLPFPLFFSTKRLFSFRLTKYCFGIFESFVIEGIR